MDPLTPRFGSRPDRVAIGKCNIVGGEGSEANGVPSRKPRLIVDTTATTVSGTNTSVVIPEKYSLPGLQDVMNSLLLRGSTSELAGFSMDIRAAHKTVRVKPEEQGLQGFEAAGNLWFYRVAPFGGSFSTLWFQRVSAFLVRLCHLLLWVQHALLAYVDDIFMVQAMFGDFALRFNAPCTLCNLRDTNILDQTSIRKLGPLDRLEL